MKKIAFFDTFSGGGAAEQETSARLEYCFNKEDIEHIKLKTNCYTFDDKEFADNINLDCFYTYGIAKDNVLPDTFSIFFHWAPLGFFSNFGINTYNTYMNKFDIVAGGYETQDAKNDCLNNKSFPNENLYNITSSISADFAIPPKKTDKRKLFYIGINLEKFVTGGGRYVTLLRYCDENNLIDIYGPPFNRRNLWEGFKSYRGFIPLDGYSVIKKINEAGICLALNSLCHNAIGSVSNRIYEGACAGAVIISDDNPYVRKYFGDSVFYIDIKEDESKQVAKLKEIIEYINKNPDEAYNMACKSQKIFIEKLSLDNQVKGLIPYIEEQKQKMTDISLQPDIIDVICFADSEEDFKLLKGEIEKQYYKNIHLIIVTGCDALKNTENADIINAEQFRGKSFINIIPHLKGEYFIILDKFSVMHKNHIYKSIKTLKDYNSLFSYSGTYIKHYDKTGKPYSYETLAHEPITNEEFLSFLCPYNSEYIGLKLEQETPAPAFVFNRKILDYVNNDEIKQISLNIPLYLVCCSLVKAEKKGKFTYSISAGYRLNEGQSLAFDILKHNDIFYKTYKYQNTFMKELIGIFSVYDTNIPYNDKLTNEFKKIKNLSNMLQKYKSHIFIKKYCNKIQNYKDIICLYKYLNENKKLYKRLKYLNKFLK